MNHKRVREWLERVGMKTLSNQPGSPWENGYVESFNGKLRDEFPDREVFETLLKSKVLIERWRKASHTVRPHSSLGYRTPAPESRCPCLLPADHPAPRKRASGITVETLEAVGERAAGIFGKQRADVRGGRGDRRPLFTAGPGPLEGVVHGRFRRCNREEAVLAVPHDFGGA